MPSTNKRTQFDQPYYQRYYLNSRTRSVSESDVQHIVDFVLAYARRLEIALHTAIDFGCGVGYWQTCLRRRLKKIQYVGIEESAFAVRKYGWTRGSVTNFASGTRHDLVICQSVLQYLNARDAARAICNLSRHTSGVLYFEVVTREDWEQYCDPSYTDGNIYLRSAKWYRERLSPHFVNAGGGVWASRNSDAVLYALEQA